MIQDFSRRVGGGRGFHLGRVAGKVILKGVEGSGFQGLITYVPYSGRDEGREFKGETQDGLDSGSATHFLRQTSNVSDPYSWVFWIRSQGLKKILKCKIITNYVYFLKHCIFQLTSSYGKSKVNKLKMPMTQ